MERFQESLEAMVLQKDAALRDRLLGGTAAHGKVTDK
jgi:hypothetical protein